VGHNAMCSFAKFLEDHVFLQNKKKYKKKSKHDHVAQPTNTGSPRWQKGDFFSILLRFQKYIFEYFFCKFPAG
jgi:hypothetical protein